jgi:hypothetical protein
MATLNSKISGYISLLGSTRQVGQKPGTSGYPEGRRAAIHLKTEYGQLAVMPVAAAIRYWSAFKPQDQSSIRELGFPDSTSAQRWSYAATTEGGWCLEHVPESFLILSSELVRGDSGHKLDAISGLGQLGKSQVLKVIELLINALSDSDDALVQAASKMLVWATGKSFFFGGNCDPSAWRRWWNKNRPTAIETEIRNNVEESGPQDAFNDYIKNVCQSGQAATLKIALDRLNKNAMGDMTVLEKARDVPYVPVLIIEQSSMILNQRLRSYNQVLRAVQHLFPNDNQIQALTEMPVTETPGTGDLSQLLAQWRFARHQVSQLEKLSDSEGVWHKEIH